ncbi:MAG: carbon monoxide dehydrogenase subunit G [Pseudomonadota bacterium]
MELQETRQINATVDQIWSSLTDVDVLRQCVPGCTEMTGSVEEGFEATVVQRVGPVKAKFKGRVIFSDMDKPKSLRISGEGSGGVAGFANGGAAVTLTPNGDETELAYEVNAKVGGKLAQLGSRIINAFARKMAGQFFKRLQGVLEADQAEAREQT